MTHALRARVSRVLAGAGVVGLLLVGSPAHAEGTTNIDHVQSKDGKGTAVLAVDGIVGGGADPSSILVEVDGTETPSRARMINAGAVDRSTMLVLDASNSMSKNGKFEAATTAVNAYLAAVPADVKVGLVTFAGEVGTPIAPTLDRQAITDAVAAVTLAPGTALNDAVMAGLDALGTAGYRSMLVLSDGSDTRSTTTLEVAAGTVAEKGVVADVVSLDPAERATALATESGGQIIPASEDGLDAAFAAQASAMSQQLLVNFTVPKDAGSESTVAITVSANGQPYTDTALVSLAAPAAAAQETAMAPKVVEAGRSLVSTPIMLGGALALFLGLAGILWIVVAAPQKKSATNRMEQYFTQTGGSRRAAASADKQGLKDTALGIADKALSQDFETRVSQRLTGAGSALTSAEWILLHAACVVGAGVVGAFLGGIPLAIIGLILGAVVPWLVLGLRHSRRLNAFNGQLAETLGLMAGGLQAGLSLPQAIDSVVQEGVEPMAGELRRALVEQRLGIDIADALEGVGHRMESPDFEWVVMAIRIQREVGGNLAEILHTVAGTLREREYLRRQVKALSAEGRLSGYILTALPVLVGTYMAFANPEYASVLWTTTIGYILLGSALFLLGIGSFFMSKLAKVEV